MAEELPETAGAATRNLLGAGGFILILLGGEILLEKTGDRFSLGLGLVLTGVPIFFVGVFWKWLQRWVATGVAEKLNWIAADPIWWVALFSVFTSFSFTQLGLATTAFLLVPLGIIYAVFAWRKAGKAKAARFGDDITIADAEWRNQRDAQIARDLLLLLNFAVDYTTMLTLQDLATKAPMNVKEGPLDLNTDFAAIHEAASNFVRHVGIKLVGEMRRSEFRTWMNEAETEVDRQIEQTPPNSLPPINPGVLRRQAITYLQGAKIIGFLRIHVAELDEQLRNQRHQLLERLTARNK